MNESVTISDYERVRVECWTRVMGYHRPISAFNVGKLSEHRERRYFTEPSAHTLQSEVSK